MPAGEAGTEGRTDTLQGHFLGFLPDLARWKDEGTDTGFTDGVSHGVQVDLGTVVQGNTHLEVNLPALMNLSRLLGSLTPGSLFPATMKSRELMQIPPDAGLVG